MFIGLYIHSSNKIASGWQLQYQQTKLLKQNNNSSSNYAQMYRYVYTQTQSNTIHILELNIERQFIQMQINLWICVCTQKRARVCVRERLFNCVQKLNIYAQIGQYHPYNGHTGWSIEFFTLQLCKEKKNELNFCIWFIPFMAYGIYSHNHYTIRWPHNKSHKQLMHASSKIFRKEN